LNRDKHPAYQGEDIVRTAKPSDRDYVAHWRRVGPALARVRKQELRNFDYKNNLEAIDALLQLGVDFARQRRTSGLVEFQRLLHKRRK
jgi:hypothetical protein